MFLIRKHFIVESKKKIHESKKAISIKIIIIHLSYVISFVVKFKYFVKQ
jgi:hypothetical protein